MPNHAVITPRGQEPCDVVPQFCAGPRGKKSPSGCDDAREQVRVHIAAGQDADHGSCFMQETSTFAFDPKRTSEVSNVSLAPASIRETPQATASDLTTPMPIVISTQSNARAVGLIIIDGELG